MSKLIKIIVNVLVFCILISAAGPAAEAAVSYSNTIEAARDAVWKTITSGKGSSATVAVMDGAKSYIRKDSDPRRGRPEKV